MRKGGAKGIVFEMKKRAKLVSGKMWAGGLDTRVVPHGGQMSQWDGAKWTWEILTGQ